MILTHNHPMLTLSSTIEDLAQPIFEKYHFNYFQYLRVHHDGSFSLLSNQAKWLEFVLEFLHKSNEPMVYSHIAQKEILSTQSYYFLWEPNLPEKPVRLAREFNIANGLTFVERFATYYDMIAFAAPVNNIHTVDIYLNYIQQLQTFIQDFKHNQKALIEKIDQHRFYPSAIQQDVNLKKMLLPQLEKPKKINVFFNEQQNYLTIQEYICLSHLAKGKTYKWIAQEMGVSARTVETYINRIKSRLHIHSKKELILLYYSNQQNTRCP